MNAIRPTSQIADNIYKSTQKGCITLNIIRIHKTLHGGHDTQLFFISIQFSESLNHLHFLYNS